MWQVRKAAQPTSSWGPNNGEHKHKPDDSQNFDNVTRDDVNANDKLYLTPVYEVTRDDVNNDVNQGGPYDVINLEPESYGNGLSFMNESFVSFCF